MLDAVGEEVAYALVRTEEEGGTEGKIAFVTYVGEGVGSVWVFLSRQDTPKRRADYVSSSDRVNKNRGVKRGPFLSFQRAQRRRRRS